MMAMQTPAHWAARLIGKPYRRGAAGPDAFDCWGLVRNVFALQHRVALPAVNIGATPCGDAAAGEETAAAVLLQAARASGFAPVAGPLQADDVLLMRNAEAGRHIGVLIAHRGTVKLLHACSGHGVRLQPLADVRLEGFHSFEPWRHAAGGAA